MQSAKDRMRKNSAEQHFSLSIGKIKYKHSNTNAVFYEMNHVMAANRMCVRMRCLVIGCRNE